jgi:hypothetical protein
MVKARRVVLRNPRSARLTIRLGVAVVALGLPGCRGCTNDHPYVPPEEPRPIVDGGGPTAEAASAGAFDGGRVEPALAAPPGATSWQTNGLTLEAGGREILLALFGDFDGDGTKDALAITRPGLADRKPGSSTGDLVFFRGGSAPAAAIASGPALGASPSCVPVARLERVGPRSAFAEIGTVCARAVAERALTVVRLGPPVPQVAFDAVVVDPPEAPKLTVDVDVVDRDHDGIDDAVLRIALDGAPRVGGRLAFFDRPAGPSRDPDEPEASLRALAAQAERASKGKDPTSAPALVQQLRALYRAMCAEGGAPRVTKIHGGSAASCGSSRALEDAGVAEARAWAAQGDVLRAVAAAEIAQLAPATRAAARTTELQKLLGELAPAVDAKAVRALSTPVDAPRDGRPEWGPLAFEPTGKLLVRRGRAAARVDPETGDAEPSDVTWAEEVVSPDGKLRWVDAYDACDAALRAGFAPTGEGDAAPVPLPIAPRLGKTCSGGRGEAAAVAPIGWSVAGLEALVAGQPVLIRPEAGQARALTTFIPEVPPLGSPRSHAGKAFVLATSSGLLVRSADRWSTVRAVLAEPYAELRGCAIADDAARIACVRRGAVVVVTPP